MKDGYRVLDMDTHVNPSLEVLAKYVDPRFRPRLEELKPYHRVRHQPRPDGTVQITTGLTVAPIPYDRFPGEAPREEHTKAVPGARTALEGRVSSHHRQAASDPHADDGRAPIRLESVSPVEEPSEEDQQAERWGEAA